MDSIVYGLIGGVMIGASAVLLMALLGRIAGVSGIVASLLPGPEAVADRNWRFAFVVGLIVGPLVIWAASGANPLGPTIAPVPVLALAGLLVGAGTTIGAGCTSGHGVCGMSRLSTRSIAATGTFLVTAIVTVFVVRHLIA